MDKIKNAAAVALGKLRWAGKTKKERSKHMKMMINRRWYLQREQGYRSWRDNHWVGKH